MKSMSKTPGSKHLKLICDEPLSKFAFKFMLGCYAKATDFGEEWIRCTTETPSFHLRETEPKILVDLAMDWINCDAYLNADGRAWRIMLAMSWDAR